MNPPLHPTSHPARGSFLFRLDLFTLDLHIAKLAGFKHFPAFFALDVFRVFVAGYDADSWVATGCAHETFAFEAGGIPVDFN